MVCWRARSCSIRSRRLRLVSRYRSGPRSLLVLPLSYGRFLRSFCRRSSRASASGSFPTFAAAVSLFIFGTIFCYLIILDPAFQWLTDQAAGLGEVVPRASTYIDMIIKFELGFGFAFELPLIVFYLVIFDIVPYKKLRGSWRTVYVVLMVVSAMATPDASPITMLLMFAALLVLYEGSLLIARVVLRNRIKKQNEELDAEEAEERAAELGIKKAKKSK